MAILPFDPTGLSPGNRVTDEVHVFSTPNFRNYHFVVPRYAPFFRNGLVILPNLPNALPMVEGVDYFLGHRYQEAEQKLGKALFGSISFYNKASLPPSIIIKSYQSIGGNWTLSEPEILEILANTDINPRVARWDQVTNYPEAFPVINHSFSVDDFIGMDHVVGVLEDINETLGYLVGVNLPTKADIGLGAVENYPPANQAEAIAGAAERYLTAAMGKIAIDYAIDQLTILELGTTAGTAFAGDSGYQLGQEVIAQGQQLNSVQNTVSQHTTALTVSPGKLKFRDPAAPNAGLPNLEVDVTSAAAANSIALRDANGRMAVGAATVDSQAVNKGQMDQAITAATQGLATDQQIQNINSNIQDLTQASDQLGNRQTTLEQQNSDLNNSLTQFETNVNQALNNKVSTVVGKGLSTNDLTDTLKTTYDNAVTVAGTANTNANAAVLGLAQQEIAPTSIFQDLGDISGSVNVDLSLGTAIIFRATGNTVITFINIPTWWSANDLRTVVFKCSRSGSFSVTWPSAKWSGGTPVVPTINNYDIVTFLQMGNGGWDAGKGLDNLS